MGKTSACFVLLPADKREGLYDGPDPGSMGKSVPAARTFSMSQAVGTICPGFDSNKSHSGAPTLPVNGPWLDGSFSHRRNSPWITYGKSSQIRAPGPSMLWVLTDEDPVGLNDAAFGIQHGDSPNGRIVPAVISNFGGCGFAFADGHSGNPSLAQNPETLFGGAITDPDAQLDWAWMRDRTSASVTGVLPAY